MNSWEQFVRRTATFNSPIVTEAEDQRHTQAGAEQDRLLQLARAAEDRIQDAEVERHAMTQDPYVRAQRRSEVTLNARARLQQEKR